MNLLLFLIIVFITTIAIFLFFTYKPKKPISQQITPIKTKPAITITSKDIKAIAGDNVMATQLDLAKAYIEMGKKQLAKKILNHVLQNGDSIQQQQAQALIIAIEPS